MNEELNKDKYLDITANIVLEAMRGGKMNLATPDDLAHCFLVVYQGVAEAAVLNASELNDLVQRWHTR